MKMHFKTWLVRILLALFCLALGFTLAISLYPNHQTDPICGALNATYQVEGQPVQLKDGRQLCQLSPRSPVCIVTQVCGAPVRGRLEGSGKNDAAVLLVQNPGGDAAYFYIAAALSSGEGNYQGTNCVFLGRDIIPLSAAIADKVIYISYVTRSQSDVLGDQVDARFAIKGQELIPLTNP